MSRRLRKRKNVALFEETPKCRDVLDSVTPMVVKSNWRVLIMRDGTDT